MGDTYSRVLTYNTHLFGDSFKSEVGNLWNKISHDWTPIIMDDEKRKDQLKCYSSNYQSFQFTTDILPKGEGWHLECVPFFAYSSGNVPVYLFQRAIAGAGYDYRCSTSNVAPSPDWQLTDTLFYATNSDDPRGVLPIFEYSDGTYYAYFPATTIMLPPGWSKTSSTPAFYSPKRGTLS